MALKSGKKKLSRKVKRTIRKTLACMCLASALVVALIPATPTRAYVEPELTTSTVNYAYGVEDADVTNLASLDANLNGISLDEHITGTPTIHRTYTVKQLSTGAYELGWQFELYTIQNGPSAGKGIICTYNSTYATGTLKIAATLPLEYLIVEEAFYNAYFDKMYEMKNVSDTVTIQYSPTDPSVTRTVPTKYHLSEISDNYTMESPQDIAMRYFPNAYADYKTRYETWLAAKNRRDQYEIEYNIWEGKYNRYVAYSNWDGTGTRPPFEENPGDPPDLVQPAGTKPEEDFWIADMHVDYRPSFFCAEHPYYQNALHGLSTAREFTLEKVIDSRNGSTTPLQYCYMPKASPHFQVTTIDVCDDYGFLGSQWTIILGIGKRAFANTTNVTALELASELKYIGDEAFYNSFVESITFDNVQDIGNRAYKNCTKLKNITLSDTTVNLGTEAFYGCNSLTSVTLPQSISYVGPGAFADCTALTNVDLSAINQSNCDIDNFAFYDCIALSNIRFSDKINRIGEAAFACTKGVTGSLTNFAFPDHINGRHTCGVHTTDTPGIGNFVLAGRTNLKTITMPSDYGRSAAVVLPVGVFYNCINLESVTFPNDGGGSCGLVTFGEVGTGSDKRTIFDTIQNEGFTVYGPATDAAGKVAGPRKSTWGKKSGLGRDVPYVYRDSSGEHVEISNGDYIFIIDDKGVLQSCVFADPQNPPATIDTMTIDSYVGGTKVTGIASTCFASTEGQDVLNRIKNLVINDNTLSEIASEAFKGCALLETVKLGNSVEKIGASAFQNCPNLESVSIGSKVKEIGNAAFKNCPKLVFVNFDTPEGGYSSFPLEGIGEEAFSTGAPKLIFEGDIDLSYGPFIWAMQKDNYVDESNGVRVCYTTGYPQYQVVIVDNRNGYPTLVDYLHFDQIDAYDTALNLTTDTSHTLTERYLKQGVEEDDGAGNIYTYSINLAEEKLVNAALNLVVPAGVKSVDANGYINNKSPLGEGYSTVASNSYNAQLYLLQRPYYAAYRSVLPADINGGGLFKNYYGTVDNSGNKREYPLNDPNEKEDIGNDRLTSVKFNSVVYLPDYAFYSCENLSSIDLGSALTEMGDAPFTGCTSLTSIGSSTDNFKCYNGIVYSENPDGTYNIVEVLSTRGVKVGSSKVKAGEEDPYLANVSTILPGAFENCDGITGVDFDGMKLLKEIPDNCFKDCEKINQVTLPDNITAIGHNAFAGCMEGIELVCYGKEVYLPADAFGSTSAGNLVNSKRVVSYADSAVRKAARDLGADVTETLDDSVKVQFFDYDGSELSKLIYVKVGQSIKLEDIPKDPVRDGYTFKGWNKPLTNITTDTVVVATYTQNTTDSGNPSGGGGSTSGNNGGQGGNGGSGTTLYTLTVTNGNGSGSYAAGATVIITCTNPPSGYVFDKWVPTTDDLGIASVNVAATTLKMPAHEASVQATFKKAPSNSNGSGNGGSGSGNNSNNGIRNGSSVVISKPGISNTDLASAKIAGSTDNYVVRIAETAAATAAVEKALTKEYGSLDGIRYSAMDITLYDSTGSTRITDYSGLSITITIPIPDVLTPYAGNNKVAGVVNEKLDKLKPKFTTIDGVPCITFTATHFSPYTIYVDTGNVVIGNSDITPKTGDGISPKWFLVFGLAALGVALFFIKDRKPVKSLAAG